MKQLCRDRLSQLKLTLLLLDLPGKRNNVKAVCLAFGVYMAVANVNMSFYQAVDFAIDLGVCTGVAYGIWRLMVMCIREKTPKTGLG